MSEPNDHLEGEDPAVPVPPNEQPNQPGEAETLPPKTRITPGQPQAGESPSSPTTAAPHSRSIGPYKLLQKLGEGGMGEVWMAEQERPVRRRVALKLIKAGLDKKQILARFEAERQALAMMDHQNIAKVLDTGTTTEGAPYFVMELVHGIPFTSYCDKNKLSINERLELFIPVCKAIQHAHQKGIIHRDLKPSNVLVCLYDGKPVPKVIDFGLAKALEHTAKLTDKTVFTEFGQVVGTLQYMSPEQAEMNQLDIDTRTDIYSLGVMLYELLAGSTPIQAESLKQNAILQVLASILEQDPPRPSARLSSSTNEVISGISAQRQIDPGKLKSILRGDLDWIVMKAIEKDRTRRYETANGFAEDITRYLSGDVVTARPPSTGYRLQKYVRRNKGLVASVATIGTLFIIGLFLISWAWRDSVLARINAEDAVLELGKQKDMVEQQRDRVDAQKKIAQQRLHLVINALGDMRDAIREERQLEVPFLKPLRAKLVNVTSDLYAKIASEHATGELNHDSLIFYAGIHQALLSGQDDELQKNFESLRNLFRSDPSSEEIRERLFDCLYMTLTFKASEIQLVDEAQALASDIETDKWKQRLAACFSIRGNLANKENMPDQALVFFTKEREVLNSLEKDAPPGRLGLNSFNIAGMQANVDPEAAIQEADRALEYFQEALQSDAYNYSAKNLLASAYANRAGILRQKQAAMGQIIPFSPEAIESIELAISLTSDLIETFPGLKQPCWLQNDNLEKFGRLLIVLETTELEAAKETFLRQLVATLTLDDSEWAVDFAEPLATSLLEKHINLILGRQRRDGRNDDYWIERGLQPFRTMAYLKPKLIVAQLLLASRLDGVGQVFASKGKLEKAVEYYQACQLQLEIAERASSMENANFYSWTRDDAIDTLKIGKISTEKRIAELLSKIEEESARLGP